MKSVKTPKRYPTRERDIVDTDKIDLGLAVPAWTLARTDAATGITHEDMGTITAIL